MRLWRGATRGVQSYKYDNLSVTVAADDLTNESLFMTNFIYQTATSGAGINVTSGGWDDLNNDFGTASVNTTVLQKVAGDFAEGMTCGFPGSNTLSASSTGTALKNLTNYESRLNPLLAYEPAQPANPFYSAYGNVVSANSGGINGITLHPGHPSRRHCTLQRGRHSASRWCHNRPRRRRKVDDL